MVDVNHKIRKKTSRGNKAANSRPRKNSPSTSSPDICSTRRNRTHHSSVGEGLPSFTVLGHDMEHNLAKRSPLDMPHLKDTDTWQTNALSKDKEIQMHADREIANHIHNQRFLESHNWENSQNRNLSSWEQCLLSIISSDPHCKLASDTHPSADKVLGTGRTVCSQISNTASSAENPSFDPMRYITPSIQESLEKDRGKKEKDSFDAYLVPGNLKEADDGGLVQQLNSTECPLPKLVLEEIEGLLEVSVHDSDHQNIKNPTFGNAISDQQKTLKRKPTESYGTVLGAQIYHSGSKPLHSNLILRPTLPQVQNPIPGPMIQDKNSCVANVFTCDAQPLGSHVEKRQICRLSPVPSIHSREEPVSGMDVPFLHRSIRSSPECKDHEASNMDHKMLGIDNTSHLITGGNPHPQFELEQMIEVQPSSSQGFVKPLLQPLSETTATTSISSLLDSDFSMQSENSFPSLPSGEDFFLGQVSMLPSLESNMSVSLNDSLVKEAEQSVFHNQLLEPPQHLQHQQQRQQYYEQQHQQQQQQQQKRQEQPQQQQKQQEQQQHDIQRGSSHQLSALRQQLYNNVSQPNWSLKSQSQQFQLLQQSQQQAHHYKSLHQQQLSQLNHPQTVHQHKESPPDNSQLHNVLQQQQQLQSHYQTQTQKSQFQRNQFQHYQTFQQPQQQQLQQMQQQQPNQSPLLEDLPLQQHLLSQSQVPQQHFLQQDTALAPGQYLQKVDHNIHYSLSPGTTPSASAVTEAAAFTHSPHTSLPQHLKVRAAPSMKGETSRSGHNAALTVIAPSPSTTFRPSPHVEATTIPSSFCSQLGSEQQLPVPFSAHQLTYQHEGQMFLKQNAAAAISSPSPFRFGPVCNFMYSTSSAAPTLHNAMTTCQPVTASTTILAPPIETNVRLASTAGSGSKRHCGFEHPHDETEFDIIFSMDTTEIDLGQNEPCVLTERGPSSTSPVSRAANMAERKIEESTAAAANIEKIVMEQKELSPKAKTTPMKEVEQRKKAVNEVIDIELEEGILQVESLSLESSLGCSSLEPDSEGETCLHLLCDLSKEFLEILPSKPGLKRALNLQSKNNEETALFIAVKKKNIDVVRFLLSQGADPNKLCRSHAMNSPTERLQQTALHEAVMIGHLEMVHQLLTAPGIEVDSRQQGSGLTPLMLACSLHAVSNRRNIIFLLLEHGASLTLAEYIQGKTPLMLAIQSRNVSLVEDLLRIVGVERARSLVMARSKTGVTCLHLAAELRIDSEEKQRLLQLIIRAGGDLSAKNDEGETAKDWARAEITQVIHNLARIRSTDGK